MVRVHAPRHPGRGSPYLINQAVRQCRVTSTDAIRNQSGSTRSRTLTWVRSELRSTSRDLPSTPESHPSLDPDYVTPRTRLQWNQQADASCLQDNTKPQAERNSTIHGELHTTRS